MSVDLTSLNEDQLRTLVAAHRKEFLGTAWDSLMDGDEAAECLDDFERDHLLVVSA